MYKCNQIPPKNLNEFALNFAGVIDHHIYNISPLTGRNVVSQQALS